MSKQNKSFQKGGRAYRTKQGMEDASKQGMTTLLSTGRFAASLSHQTKGPLQNPTLIASEGINSALIILRHEPICSISISMAARLYQNDGPDLSQQCNIWYIALKAVAVSFAAIVQNLYTWITVVHSTEYLGKRPCLRTIEQHRLHSIHCKGAQLAACIRRNRTV